MSNLNGTVWTFNDVPVLPNLNVDEGMYMWMTGISESNQDLPIIQLYDATSIWGLYIYDDRIVYEPSNGVPSITAYTTSGGWTNSNYKTITFIDEPAFINDGEDLEGNTIDFMDWFEANATRQAITYLTTDIELGSIADVIRTKTGGSAGLEFPDDFVSAIGNLADTSNATATAADIKSGKTAYANGVKLSGSYNPVIAEVSSVSETMKQKLYNNITTGTTYSFTIPSKYLATSVSVTSITGTNSFVDSSYFNTPTTTTKTVAGLTFIDKVQLKAKKNATVQSGSYYLIIGLSITGLSIT